MPVNWNSHEILQWTKAATEEQQAYYELLGKEKWTRYKPSDYTNLKRNIGFALFGPPEEKPDMIVNGNTGYAHKKLQHIDEVFDVIMECKKKHKKQEDLLLSFLFISGKVDDGSISIPVIRMCEYDSFAKESNIFIDSCPRVYKRWKDYLKCNRLPELVLCYPKNGVYSAENGLVQVHFGISPAGQTEAKIFEGLDIGGTVLGLGATGVGIATLFTPVGLPLVIGAFAVSVAAGGYGIGRSTQTLVDRHQHQQSIGLDNAESRNCWLGIGGGVMGMAAGGAAAAAAKMAQVGQGVTVAGQIALKSVTAGSSFVNALGVVNGLANIIVQAVNEGEVSALDIFQFTSSVLFFTNSVISTHQAHNLINSIGKSGTGQKAMLSAMNEISKLVKKPINGVTGIDTVYFDGSSLFPGSASMMASCSVQKFFGICRFFCRKLTEITKSLLKGLVTVTRYVMEIGEHLHSFWESWNEEITEVINKICKAFGVKHWSDITIRGHKCLEGVLPDQIKEIAATVLAERNSLANSGTTGRPQLSLGNAAGGITSCNGNNSLVDEEAQTALSYQDEVINIQAKFVDLQMCKNPVDFLRYQKFVCKFVQSEFEKEKLKYKEMWEMVQNFNIDAKKEDFYKMCKITGNPNNHFLQEVLKKFTDKEKDGFFQLKFAYDSQNATSSAQEESGQSFFVMDGISFHHFYNKIGLASDGMLSNEQFYMMAAELTRQYANRDNVLLVVDGATAVMQVSDGTIIITVNSYLQDGKVSGIATILRNPSH